MGHLRMKTRPQEKLTEVVPPCRVKPCDTCRNRSVTTERVLLPGVSPVTGLIMNGVVERAEYVTQRCRLDRVEGKHPFGDTGRGPVLTCREMLLNGCAGGEWYTPVRLEDA